MKQFKFTQPVILTDEEITDIIITALEGGIGYWARLDNTTSDFTELYNTTDIATSEITAKLLFDGKAVTFEDTEEEKTYQLTLENLLKGIQMAISDGRELMGDYDAIDADIAFQYAIIGDVIYG